MDPHVKSFFVIYFLFFTNVLTEEAIGSSDYSNDDETFVETTEDNPSRIEDVTTKTHDDSFSTISAYVGDKENITDEFKPSVHLGEIEEVVEEPRTKTNPFNEVHHVKFDDGFDLGSSDREDPPVEHRIPYDFNERENGRIVFDEEKRNFHVGNNRQRFIPYRETIQPKKKFHFAVVQSSRSPFFDNNLGEDKLTNDHRTYVKNLEKPTTPVYLGEEHASIIFDKPMRFPNELREHLNFDGNGNFDDKSTFYFVPDYRLIVPNHHNNYYNVDQQRQQQQQLQQEGEKEVGGSYGNVKKANDMTVYLAHQNEYATTTTTTTTLSEQPHYYYYYYYQPAGYHEMDFLGEPKPALLYPKGHR